MLKSPKWRLVLRILISFIAGSAFYTVWLAIFLWIDSQKGFIEVLLFILAPLVTGFGFGIGIYYFNRICGDHQGSFKQIVIWPILGCILGALVVYWFGPMLIVFSMLIFGGLSVSIREIILHRQNTREGT